MRTLGSSPDEHTRGTVEQRNKNKNDEEMFVSFIVGHLAFLTCNPTRANLQIRMCFGSQSIGTDHEIRATMVGIPLMDVLVVIGV